MDCGVWLLQVLWRHGWYLWCRVGHVGSLLHLGPANQTSHIEGTHHDKDDWLGREQRGWRVDLCNSHLFRSADEGLVLGL